MRKIVNKPIFDITPFTILDYPNHLACIVWFSGCNMRCKYCYNPNIVLENGKQEILQLLSFLKTRVGLLEGVVLSGGECTLYKDIFSLCKSIKELGFKIKIDTNGSNPKTLKILIENALIDYVALDFKASKNLFQNITNSNFYVQSVESLKMLNESDIAFEVRTTVHADLIDENEINEIIEVLHENKYKGKYFLQNYLHVDKTLGCIDSPKKFIDSDLLKTLVPIIWRN